MECAHWEKAHLAEAQRLITALRNKIDTLEIDRQEISALRQKLQGYRQLAAEVVAMTEQLAREPRVLASLSP